MKTTLPSQTPAESGSDLALVAEKSLDLIFMDVQMPGLGGVTACAKLDKTELNRTTPVVFVTGQSDFNARTQMSRSGGSDFVGKPFLKSEITVKALTFALRGWLKKMETVMTRGNRESDCCGHLTMVGGRKPVRTDSRKEMVGNML